MKTFVVSAALFLGMAASVQAADEFAIKLKPGAGSDLAQTYCAACHSLDYIQMNSPFLDSKGWTAEVTKMVNAFGADISESDAKQIADYLGKNYSP